MHHLLYGGADRTEKSALMNMTSLVRPRGQERRKARCCEGGGEGPERGVKTRIGEVSGGMRPTPKGEEK